MESATRAGRIIGALILAQMVGGIMVNFVLEAPLFGTPGFLVNAASHSQQIGLAAVLGLVTEALWLGIAITAFPVFKQRMPAMAICFVALAGVVLALAFVENAAVMSMVSLSEAYAKASSAEREQLQTVRIIVASARNWPHFLARIFDGVTIFAFCAVLFRSALIPRAISGFGLIAAVSQMLGIGVALFGHDVIFPMLAPLGLSLLILGVWLMARGFRSQPASAVESGRV